MNDQSILENVQNPDNDDWVIILNSETTPYTPEYYPTEKRAMDAADDARGMRRVTSVDVFRRVVRLDPYAVTEAK